MRIQQLTQVIMVLISMLISPTELDPKIAAMTPGIRKVNKKGEENADATDDAGKDDDDIATVEINKKKKRTSEESCKFLHEQIEGELMEIVSMQYRLEDKVGRLHTKFDFIMEKLEKRDATSCGKYENILNTL